MTPEDVAALFASKPPPATVQAEEGGHEVEDEHEDQDQVQVQVAAGSATHDDTRTQELERVLTYVGELYESGSETLDLVAQKIGDGSRDGESLAPRPAASSGPGPDPGPGPGPGLGLLTNPLLPQPRGGFRLDARVCSASSSGSWPRMT